MTGRSQMPMQILWKNQVELVFIFDFGHDFGRIAVCLFALSREMLTNFNVFELDLI
jgi:hypothetical protein